MPIDRDYTISYPLPTLLPPLQGESPWTVAEDWPVTFKGCTWIVPRGFRTDGASIPRFLWRLCGTPLKAPRICAAILHDYLYSGIDDDLTRSQADCVFRDLQISAGVNPVVAYLEWAILRLFGGRHWKKGKEQQK